VTEIPYGQATVGREGRGWQAIPGWFDWQDVYARWAAEAQDGDVFVEVGVFLGRSLAFLLEQLRGKRVTVYAVDPWQDDWRTDAQKEAIRDDTSRLEGLDTWGGDLKDASYAHGGPFGSFLWHLMTHCTSEDIEKVRVIRAGSVDAARLVGGADGRLLGVDYVWIDGDHNYGAVSSDIAAWRHLARKRIGGHDHTPEYPGVVRAAEEAFGPGRHASTSSWEVAAPREVGR
jgi:hypothetical protein